MAKPVVPKRAPTMEEMLTAPSATIFEVRLGQATYLKQAANELFDEQKYEDAMKLYDRALFHCNFEKTEMKFEFTDEYKHNIQETINPVYLNLARCCIKLKRYREAIKYAKNVLEQQDITSSSTPSSSSPSTPSSDITSSENNNNFKNPIIPNNNLHIAQNKAKYLIGKALIALEEYEEAIKYISDKGDKAIPPDKGHLALLKEAKDGILKNKKHEQQVWKGRLKSDEISPPKNNSILSTTYEQIKKVLSSNKQILLIIGIAFIGIIVALLYKKRIENKII